MVRFKMYLSTYGRRDIIFSIVAECAHLYMHYRSLGVRKLTKSPYLEVYLFPPEGDCNIWSFDVLAEFLIVNRIQGGKQQRAVCHIFQL